jgi:SAM-dependent methyltransferase
MGQFERMGYVTYSTHFTDEDEAGRYDEGEYAPDSYSTLLWGIERKQLDDVLARRARPGFAYLDFACGTGRVLAHVTPRAGTSVGIDVSEAMASRARKRVRGARVFTRDITSDASVEGHYDVITAYRFLLNAEPALRRAALDALKSRLRDSSSILIMNNHGNLASHKALMALPNWIRHRGQRQPSGNVLAHRAVKRLFEGAGLHVDRVAGCGLLGGHLAKLLPGRLVEGIEARFARTPLSRLGSNQLYVAQLQG